MELFVKRCTGLPHRKLQSRFENREASRFTTHDRRSLPHLPNRADQNSAGSHTTVGRCRHRRARMHAVSDSVNSVIITEVL